MFENPFTPIFGGKPDFFFGRKGVINRFERALQVRGSEDRALFITGTRGNGKTALAEQLAMRASDAGWTVIDTAAENALASFFRQIQGHDEESSAIDPSVEIKVLGSGGSVKGKSKTKTAHYSLDDLDTLFIRTCKKSARGILLIIDEIQKTPLEDVSRICGAFQMASKKGSDVALVAAGLPYSHERVIQHDGCTYMRRSVHEPINLFDPSETLEAFKEAFRNIRGLSINDAALKELVRNSSGHPYMMQLLGYHLVEYVNGKVTGRSYEITIDDVNKTAPMALSAYERRALEPLVEAMSNNERDYLRAMAATADDKRLSATSEIASRLGKTTSQLSSCRQALIDDGVIMSPEHGKVRFGIPFLRDYVQKERLDNMAANILEIWDV